MAYARTRLDNIVYFGIDMYPKISPETGMALRQTSFGVYVPADYDLKNPFL